MASLCEALDVATRNGDIGRTRGNTMFRRALSRFTIAALAAAVATGLAGYAPANAEPPTHDKSIVKDVEATIPPLAECPAGNAASIDLVFHDIFHLHFTDTTFHVTATQTGTFVTRSATGDELASGHFTTTLSDQGPGFPKESFTSHINATGKATDGTQVRIHIAQHFTINANGDVTVDRFTAGCN